MAGGSGANQGAPIQTPTMGTTTPAPNVPAAPQSSGGFGEWLTGKQPDVQGAQTWMQDPKNQQLANTAAMYQMLGQPQQSQQLLQGTPLQQNTGGALGSLTRTVTGSNPQNPYESIGNLALNAGLSYLRRGQALSALQANQSQMQNAANQMTASQRHAVAGY